MDRKERNPTLLVILAVLIILVLGVGYIEYLVSRTPAPSNLSPVATDTVMDIIPAPVHSLITASFSGNPISLELATTTAKQQLGLGNRPEVPDNYGMLFVFATDGSYAFWMKDMEVPLDMFWLSDNGTVTTLMADVATSTYPGVLYPTEAARYVLETKAGYAAEHGIHLGSTLTGLPFL